MGNALQIGFPPVPKSITNPNVKRKDALDIDGPIPFLSFIKLSSVTFEPKVYQEYYTHYIKLWNKKINDKPTDEKAIIVAQYRNFVQDVALKYTTPEEKDFLNKIDFSNPLDLDIVLGFYSKKIKELTLYFNKKRHSVKNSVTKGKLQGSVFGISKTITEVVLQYLNSLENGDILFDYDEISEKIEVEVEELYDSFPDYFDQLPDDQIYDRKDLDYGLNIFLVDDESLIESVFSGMSETMKQIKEVDQLFENKRKLTEKYMAFPMYYIQTGDTTTDILSGKLFDNENTANNFLNRSYPTTASSETSYQLKNKYEKGFFRPSNTAIIILDGVNGTYKINYESLEPNSLYFFPDPSKIGENGPVLLFTIDDTYLKRNFTSGSAVNQPSTSKGDTKYNGYVSLIDPIGPRNLEYIFDTGWIKDSKRDIYGNQYGLFKKDGKFEQTLVDTNTVTTSCFVVDGYTFFDYIFDEGYAFDWSQTDFTTYSELRRSGLTLSAGEFTNFDPDIIFNYGSFTKNYEIPSFSEGDLQISLGTYENGFFKPELGFYDDPQSSDLSSFEYVFINDLSSFYYDELLECGITDIDPLSRALLDPSYPTLSANFLTYGNTLTAFTTIDSGDFGTIYPSTEYRTYGEYYYYPTSNNPTVVSLSSEPTLIDGSIYVKNSYTKETLPLLEAITSITTNYPSYITSQMLSAINAFEVYSDTLVIETKNWLTINSITMIDGVFSDSLDQQVIIPHSLSSFDSISNRVLVKNDIFFCKFTTTSAISSTNFVLYPEIYKYNTINRKSDLIFPNLLTLDTTHFNVSGGDVLYTFSNPPVLNYDGRTDSFIISLPFYDQNQNVYIHNYPFYLNPEPVWGTHSIVNFVDHNKSYLFDQNTSYFVYLSSSGVNPITSSEGELIL